MVESSFSQAKKDNFHMGDITKEEWEKYQNVSEQEIKDKLHVPDNYYIDLRLMKDFHVGALIYTILQQPKEKQETYYKELLSMYDRYRLRICDDDKPISDHSLYKEAMERLKDPKQQYPLFLCSPSNNIFTSLDKDLYRNVNNSPVAEKYKKIPIKDDPTKPHHHYRDWKQITFYINIYPFPQDSRVGVLSASYLRERYDVDVYVLSIPPKTFPKKLFKKIDQYYCYRFDYFWESPDVKACMEEGMMKYPNKQGYATPLLSEEKVSQHPNLLQDLQRFKGLIMMFFKLDFIPPEVYGSTPNRKDKKLKNV